MIYKQIQGLMLNIFPLFGIKALPLVRVAFCKLSINRPHCFFISDQL